MDFLEVSKRYDGYLLNLETHDFTYINDKGAGLYFKRLCKKHPDTIYCKSNYKDNFTLFKRRPIQKTTEKAKHTIFRKLFW